MWRKWPKAMRGNLAKILYCDGQSSCLFAKRLEEGRFVGPITIEGSVTLMPAQLLTSPPYSDHAGPELSAS